MDVVGFALEGGLAVRKFVQSPLALCLPPPQALPPQALPPQVMTAAAMPAAMPSLVASTSMAMTVAASPPRKRRLVGDLALVSQEGRPGLAILDLYKVCGA
ncbi:hypothetical protein MMPV_000724 [Pyropia vietnamensis]